MKLFNTEVIITSKILITPDLSMIKATTKKYITLKLKKLWNRYNSRLHKGDFEGIIAFEHLDNFLDAPLHLYVMKSMKIESVQEERYL